ncbi:unnamed protein product [Lathyrus sativus]|nr:unnamed protein product [Lathyrus sativus]
MVTMKQGRGRPKSTVPSSPETITSLKTPELESRNTTTNLKTPEIESRTTTVEDTNITNTLENETKKILTETIQTQPEERKLWADVINDNRNPTKGMEIESVVPKVVNGVIEIEIEQEDIATEIQFWENSLILYVVGDDLSMNKMKNFMQRMWNFVKMPDLYYHDDGYFLLRFNSQEDKEAVMMKDPYTIRNMLMILKEWQTGFNLKKDLLRKLPI